jgi:uncharacterized protein YndB with AHSA1/START domain
MISVAPNRAKRYLMVPNVMVVVERQFDYPQQVLFDAWTRPEQMMEWRGSPGWHVERDTVTSDLRLGGRHHHVKVVDDDPSVRVTTDAIFTEFFPPDVFVERQRITGDAGIDPNVAMEQRVELIKTGRDATLVRIIQGPYEASEAEYHTTGWERELNRLEAYLAEHRVPGAAR